MSQREAQILVSPDGKNEWAFTDPIEVNNFLARGWKPAPVKQEPTPSNKSKTPNNKTK